MLTKMFNFFKKKITSTDTHLYMQLTPIPYDVIDFQEVDVDGCINCSSRVKRPDEMGDDVIHVTEFILKEKEDFLKWANIDNDHYVADAIYAGFKTGFCILHTLPKDMDAEQVREKFESTTCWLSDVYWDCTMSDKDAVLDGQKYNKRCRWIKKWA